MRRSDLRRLGAMPPEKQRAAIDAMWRAYDRAEAGGQGGDVCPLTYVATAAEVLEAALGALEAEPRDPYGVRPGLVRWDMGGDGEYASRYPDPGVDPAGFEAARCGEPNAHPSHLWKRTTMPEWRWCTGQALTDQQFHAMHPIRTFPTSAFVDTTPPDELRARDACTFGPVPHPEHEIEPVTGDPLTCPGYAAPDLLACDRATPHGVHSWSKDPILPPYRCPGIAKAVACESRHRHGHHRVGPDSWCPGVETTPNRPPDAPLAPAIAVREAGPWTLVTDVRVPPGVVLVGAPEQLERVLTDWTRASLGEPVRVDLDEVVVLRVERPE